MAKQEKVVKVVRINRSAAANKVVAAVNGKTTLGELAEKADALFVKHGGESKIGAAAYYVKRALDTAESLGVLKLTRPTSWLRRSSSGTMVGGRHVAGVAAAIALTGSHA